jgi:hypothetical protein
LWRVVRSCFRPPIGARRDGPCRTNPRFHELIESFNRKTGCPALVNTSFNVRGEPIVCTPEDAFRRFMGNEIELLVLGNCMLRKAERKPALKVSDGNDFDPDRATEPIPSNLSRVASPRIGATTLDRGSGRTTIGMGSRGLAEFMLQCGNSVDTRQCGS